MGIIFAANTDDRLYQVGTPYDTLGGLTDFDIAVQFLLTGSTGTSAANIIAKGSDRFVLRRKAGTVSNLQLLFRNSADSVTTMELGSVAVDTWHTVRLRWDGSTQTAYVNGSSVATASAAGTWTNNNTDFFQIGTSNTSGGIGVKIAQFGGWATKLGTSDAALVDGGTTAWSTIDESGKDEWFLFDFLQNTSGTANTADASMDNLNTAAASLGDLRTWPGKTEPTYDATTPLGDPEALTLRVACGGVVSENDTDGAAFDSGDTISLGTIPQTWSDSTNPRVLLSIESSGTANPVTAINVSASGNATLISPVSEIASLAVGSSQNIVLELSTASAGSNTTTVTITSDELTDQTVTLNWNVRTDADRTALPGAGFSSPPTQSDTQIGSGDFTHRPAARCDVAEMLWVDGDELLVTVAAEHAHIGWIERVEVYFESDTVSRTIYTPANTPSARTGAVGFQFTLDVSGEDAGEYSFYVKVIPAEGKERQLGPFAVTFDTDGTLTAGTIYLSESGSDSNNGLTTGTPKLTLKKALELCSNTTGGYNIVCTTAGEYDASRSTTETIRASTRVNRVTLADGLDYGDVVFTQTTRDANTAWRTRKIQFEDIKFDSEKVGFDAQGSDAGTGKAILNFVRCGFVDIDNGAGGPAYGHPSLGATSTSFSEGEQWVQSYAEEKTNSQIAFYNTREVVGFSGLTGPNTLIAGGIDGDAIPSEHGGDNIYDTRAAFHYNFTEGTGVSAWIRYTEEETLTVSSVSYNGGTDETTITFSGSPTLRDDTGADSLDANGRVYGIASGAPDPDTAYPFVAGTVNNTAKTIRVEGDCTSDFPTSTVVFFGVEQHRDTWQFNLDDGDDNIICQRGFWRMAVTQPSLLQIPTGTGTLSSIGLQLVALNGGDFFRWQEIYKNLVIRQCSISEVTQSITGTVDDSAFVGSAISTAAFTAINSAAAPSGYNTTTIEPTEGGDLLGLYLPRLPVDYYGRSVARDGTGYMGALQFAVPASPDPDAALGGTTGAWIVGEILYIAFTEAINVGAGATSGFSLDTNGGPSVTIANPSATLSPITTLSLTLIGWDASAVSTATLTFTNSGRYTTDSNGAPIENFTDLDVGIGTNDAGSNARDRLYDERGQASRGRP